MRSLVQEVKAVLGIPITTSVKEVSLKYLLSGWDGHSNPNRVIDKHVDLILAEHGVPEIVLCLTMNDITPDVRFSDVRPSDIKFSNKPYQYASYVVLVQPNNTGRFMKVKSGNTAFVDVWNSAMLTWFEEINELYK